MSCEAVKGAAEWQKGVPVTHLRKMMLEKLQRRLYSEATTECYTPPHSYQIETAYRINNRG
jgi:hypothetical protein